MAGAAVLPAGTAWADPPPGGGGEGPPEGEVDHCVVCDTPCSNFVDIGASCTLGGEIMIGGIACPNTWTCQAENNCKK